MTTTRAKDFAEEDVITSGAADLLHHYPAGLDCCVSYDEPIIASLRGTLVTSVNSLNSRRDSSQLNVLTENILLVTVILTNKKLITVVLNHPQQTENRVCFYTDYASLQDLDNKLHCVSRALNVFEINGEGRCRKGVTQYCGEFDLHYKIRGMGDEVYGLVEWMRANVGSDKFISAIQSSESLISRFWGSVSSTTGLAGAMFLSLVKGLRNELILLRFMDEGLLLMKGDCDGGKIIEVIHLNRILFGFKRLHGSRLSDIELHFVKRRKTVKTILLRFYSEEDFLKSVHSLSPKLFIAQSDPKFHQHMTSLWSNGKLSNYHYLSFLNTLGGRSKNDYTTYPVYPWTLIRDFAFINDLAQRVRQSEDGTSQVIDRKNVVPEEEMRNFAKPIGAQDEKQLQDLIEKQEYLKDNSETPYLYGSHYSNAAYVSHWLVRKHYEVNMLINEGRLDFLSRSFTDVRLSWSRTKEEHNCFMELIPEFYEHDAELFDQVMEDGEGDVGVILPKVNLHCSSPFTHCQCATATCVCKPEWLSNDSLWFLFVHRLVLESPVVSHAIAGWIDLIFGYKQKGESARKDYNLFHPASYLASNMGVDLVLGGGSGHAKRCDECLVTQALEFGQCPMQVLSNAHPTRSCSGALWSRAMTRQELWDLYLAFCSGDHSVLSSCSWVEFLLKHPRSFPPVARMPSVWHCSARDHVIVRYGETEARIWAGLANTVCLTAEPVGKLPVTPAKPVELWQREVAHHDLICRYSNNGRYKVFSCFEEDGSDVYETSVNQKLTAAAWDSHRHLYLGGRDGSISVGGVGSHFHTGATYNLNPVVLKNTRSVHRGAITTLKCTRDRLLSGCAKETVCVWDVACETPVVQAEGWHNGRITCVEMVDDSIVYSADAKGVLAVHDVRMPVWRAEAFPPLKFGAFWYVSTMTRPPNTHSFQVVLSDSPQSAEAATVPNMAVFLLDTVSCKSVAAPTLFGSKSHLPLNGTKLKGTVVSSGGASVIEVEGSDALLAVREKDVVCYRDSKMVKSWELPVSGSGVTSLHAFPKLTDTADELGHSILKPFVRAYSSAQDQTLLLR